jgi:hypothetical protein
MLTLKRKFACLFAPTLALTLWSAGVAVSAPFFPGPGDVIDVTGTFGSTGQTVSGTLVFGPTSTTNRGIESANISISGFPGVFTTVIGQDSGPPPITFPPAPPDEFEWFVAIRQSGPLNSPRMGIVFLVESLDAGNSIGGILGPIVDGNYINPPVDCVTGTCTHSADMLTGSLAPAPAQTPLPAALPLFASGLGVLGLLGWRRKKNAAG